MNKNKFQLNNDEQVLCRILNRTADGIPSTEEFLKFAIDNQIAPAAGHIIKAKKRNPDAIEQQFINEHEKVKTYLSHYLSELDDLAAELAKNGIKVVALKNAGIARAIFDCVGCCPMGDLDLLVEKRDFLKAHEILLQKQFVFKYRSYLEKESIQNALLSGGAEYWKQLTTGEKLWLELQFRPVAGRWIGYKQEPDASELINNSLIIEGTNVRILSPEDNLLQVSLHTAKHSYIREPGFRLHTDVDRIVRNQRIDWNVFINKVKKLRVTRPVYFSLLIPYELLKTPIPADVIGCLAPSKFVQNTIIGMLNKGGLFNPTNKKFGKLAYLLFSILLYDSLTLLWANLFPPKEQMMEKYSCKQALVPVFYVKRFFDLLIRRQRT